LFSVDHGLPAQHACSTHCWPFSLWSWALSFNRECYKSQVPPKIMGGFKIRLKQGSSQKVKIEDKWQVKNWWGRFKIQGTNRAWIRVIQEWFKEVAAEVACPDCQLFPPSHNPKMTKLSSLPWACTSAVENALQYCFTVLLGLDQEAGSLPGCPA
jgi:hypothetical protein